jgi:hypothetical protein
VLERSFSYNRKESVCCPPVADPIVLVSCSHFSLLLGCALPLWLAPALPAPSLASFAGVLSIGLGDTMVSVPLQKGTRSLDRFAPSSISAGLERPFQESARLEVRSEERAGLEVLEGKCGILTSFYETRGISHCFSLEDCLTFFSAAWALRRRESSCRKRNKTNPASFM